MSDIRTDIVPTRTYDTGLDNYMSTVVLERTMSDVVRDREKPSNAKAYTVNSMIFNAVFEMDIDLIKTIVLRVDGTVPDEGRRDGYANLIGDALDDVLDSTSPDQMKVYPYDPPIIAMAKVLVHVASQPAGTNYAKKKERNLAANMILERTGGRKVQPTKPMIEAKYVEPEWMKLNATD